MSKNYDIPKLSSLKKMSNEKLLDLQRRFNVEDSNFYQVYNNKSEPYRTAILDIEDILKERKQTNEQ